MSSKVSTQSRSLLARAPKYPRHGPLRAELNRRVDAYFVDNNLQKTGGWRLFLKAAIIVGWFCGSYAAMVFWADAWWHVGLWAVSLGLAQAGIGFSVMHDGGHGASSQRPWLTGLAARTLDMIGGSSQLWAFKHNIIHHQYPNVDGVDHDIIVEPWLRMAESQKRRPYHSKQHLYFPLAYAFLSGKWLLHDDFRTLITGRLGHMRIPPMSRGKVAEILFWKLFAIGWALVVPIALHGIGWTLATFAVWASVSGVALATVFQLAHCVDDAELITAPAQGERMPKCWAEQQLATTVDFAPNNPLVTWYVGGLNFQIEHHLFPKISHVHYPKIAPIVREVCAEFGVRHHTQETLSMALMSHARHLQKLGQAPMPAAVHEVAREA
jgi:linoleoyl-CoA desaturase